MINALELYCGIGGFAKASQKLPLNIKYAYDQNDNALLTYNQNFTHKATKFNLEQFDATHLEALHVDFLWMSPPCQPYTTKGNQKDLEDNRTGSFKNVLNAIFTCKTPPSHIGVENVEGFANSQGRDLLIGTLKEMGYNISENLLCPSELGIPNRRLRYYLCASKKPLKALEKSFTCKALSEFVKSPQNPNLIPQEILEKFSEGFRILDENDTQAYTTCFTSSYSKSWMHSGAYLKSRDGVRLFEPEEIANLMGFGENFVFDPTLSQRQKYKLIGNSLSVFALEVILSQFDLS